ncbi:MAG: polyphosphate:AMP phosphotransferase [Planctomycetota bacterium]
MFETAELDQKISKHEYQEQVPALRAELLEAQVRLRELGLPVVVLFAGVDGAGKGETANLLSAWMDPHLLVTRAYGKPSDEERERPELWRFWRDLPARGQMGVFLSAWYSKPILSRVYGRSSMQAFDEQLNDIVSFESTLRQDGALILKFWMHLGKQAQKKRFRTLEADPLQRWRVTKRDWKHWKLYDAFVEAAEHTIARTSRGGSPWKIVDGADARYRSITVATFLLDGLKRNILEAERRAALLEEQEEQEGQEAGPPAPTDEAERNGAPEAEVVTAPTTVLDALDMGQGLPKDEYQQALAKYQARLNLLQRTARDRGISTILIFEGWDAAGKGGAIRRLIAPLDARGYQVISISAPTDEELAHHYLWRFWRQLPRAGRFTIFDRSWYGRVLVERVEGFASEREWRRAYGEINDFERQLVQHGTVVVKFWLHITPKEQEERFQARLEVPYKRWKLTPEDWRNRNRWRDYELAVHDMVERTSTHFAPWHLVEGNDKRLARVKVLRTVCRALESSLEPGKDEA